MDNSLLLQQIADLTCSRDESELFRLIGQLMKNRLGFDSVYLYRVGADKVEEILGDGNAQREPLSDTQLMEFVQRKPFPYLLHSSRSDEWALSALYEDDKKAVVLALAKNPELSFQANSILQIAHNQLTMIARHERDALTGLYNRHAFNDKTQELLTRFRQQRREMDEKSIAFVMLDIDHFKRINDDYGHLYGDEVLILFARVMQHSFRNDDLLFRYGGEEFAVLLCSVDEEIAEKILNRFREKIAQYEFPQVKNVTVSIGFTMVDSVETASTMIDRADKALYYAKGNGRNRVENFEKLKARGLAALDSHKDDIELF